MCHAQQDAASHQPRQDIELSSCVKAPTNRAAPRNLCLALQSVGLRFTVLLRKVRYRSRRLASGGTRSAGGHPFFAAALGRRLDSATTRCNNSLKAITAKRRPATSRRQACARRGRGRPDGGDGGIWICAFFQPVAGTSRRGVVVWRVWPSLAVAVTWPVPVGAMVMVII